MAEKESTSKSGATSAQWILLAEGNKSHAQFVEKSVARFYQVETVATARRLVAADLSGFTALLLANELADRKGLDALRDMVRVGELPIPVLFLIVTIQPGGSG